MRSGICRGHLLKRPGGDREMVEILSLVLQHDEQAVLCAVELALDAGAPTKTHILNVLHRLVGRLLGVPGRCWGEQMVPEEETYGRPSC